MTAATRSSCTNAAHGDHHDVAGVADPGPRRCADCDTGGADDGGCRRAPASSRSATVSVAARGAAGSVTVRHGLDNPGLRRRIRRTRHRRRESRPRRCCVRPTRRCLVTVVDRGRNMVLPYDASPASAGRSGRHNRAARPARRAGPVRVRAPRRGGARARAGGRADPGADQVRAAGQAICDLAAAAGPRHHHRRCSWAAAASSVRCWGRSRTT